MKIDIKNPKIDFAATGPDEILRNVRMIITTVAGTVPFDREFGVNIDFLDLPLPQAQGRLTIEYIEKIRRYEPRVKVEEVTFTQDPLNGVIITKVVISFAD